MVLQHKMRRFWKHTYVHETFSRFNICPLAPHNPLSLQPIQLDDSYVVLCSTSVSCASLLSIHAPATLTLPPRKLEKPPCQATKSNFYRGQSTYCQQSFFFVDATAAATCMEFPNGNTHSAVFLF